MEPPALFIKTLFETWRATPHAAALLGLDERAAEELLAGTLPEGREIRERIVCLYQIRQNTVVADAGQRGGAGVASGAA